MSAMNSRNVFIAALTLLVAVLAAPSLSSASDPLFTVTAAKQSDGNYKAGIQNASISQGETKLFFWKIETDESVDQSISFDDAATGDAGGDDYKIKWYKGKKPKSSKDVSSAVKGAGYDFTLKAMKRKFFTAKVKPKPEAESLCLGGQASNNPQTYVDAAYFAVNGLCA